MADWSMWPRTPDYALGVQELPISSMSGVRRHLGVDTAVLTTPYTPQAWGELAPGCGAELWRNGRQEITGSLSARTFTRDDDGNLVIKAEIVGDVQHLADRVTMPDPGRAADDQTVNDYWTFPATPLPGLQVQAGQAILTRLQSGQTFYEDWTWPNPPDSVNQYNDDLLAAYPGAWDDIPVATAWLQSYVATNTPGQPSAVASTAMLQLISDQAGPTCHPDRRVPGLVLGVDPGVGYMRPWSALFTPLLDQLTLMSVASGANLGVRTSTSTGQLTADIVAPRNLKDDIRFSADLSNLGAIEYREAAPTATHALSAGQGDLHARMRKLAVTTDPLALQYGRQMWSYIDRRDTDDVAELLQAAQDALADGGPTVSLAVTLLDTDAARYGTDYDVGDLVTVYVGVPGQVKVATVSDVIREIRFDVDSNGAETIRPAIGSYDAKAAVPTPTQQQLARVGQSLRGLIART